jgi:hypothetical protein
MSLSPTDYFLWGTGIVLLVLTGGAILKRHLVRELPLFLIYVAFQLLRSAALIVTHVLMLQHRLSYAHYFYLYWDTEAVSIVLSLLVVYGIYRKIFDNYDALKQVVSVVLAGTAVVLLLAAVLTAAMAPGADAPGIVKVVLLMERSARVLQCGLLAMLFALVLYFGLPWQNRLFGVALGFGVYSCLQLIASSLRSVVGETFADAYSQAQSAAYGIGVMIWFGYLVAPDPLPEHRGAIIHDDLEKWNRALKELIKR